MKPKKTLTGQQQKALDEALRFEARLRVDAEKLEESVQERNRAIRAAVDAGVPVSTIARTLDLSVTRINQIRETP